MSTDTRNYVVIPNEPLVVLNDQGGAVMSITNEVTCTLRARANHPPIICLEGNGARPSHRGGEYSEDGRMFTLNTVDRHSVCYEKPAEVLVFKERAGKPGGGKGILITEDKTFTLSTLQDEAICYEIYDARGNGEGGVAPTITGDHENRVTDYTAILVLGNSNSKATIVDDDTSPTLLGTRGGMETSQYSCWAIDSHPTDSRIRIVGGVDAQQ